MTSNHNNRQQQLLVARLERLAKTMTQSEASRAVQRSRSRIQQIAQEYDIRFQKRHAVGPTPRPRCTRGHLHTSGRSCLRCKWTAQRIRALRSKSGLSQINLSLALGMNVWAVSRWENGYHAPSAHAIQALEAFARRASSPPPARTIAH